MNEPYHGFTQEQSERMLLPTFQRTQRHTTS